MSAAKALNPLITFEHKRDAYGFAVRPQHLQRYREYANIYKEEEEERSDRWKNFLEQIEDSAQLPVNGLLSEEDNKELHTESTQQEADGGSGKSVEGDYLGDKKTVTDSSSESFSEKEEEMPPSAERKTHKIQIWSKIRPSLHAIEHMMSFRVKKRSKLSKDEQCAGTSKALPPIEEARPSKGSSEEDSEEEFYDVERSDPVQDVPSSESMTASAASDTGSVVSIESLFPWKEELECLVRGGVPMALRGELWQAFVGARARRVEKYYQDLLSAAGDNTGSNNLNSDNSTKELSEERVYVPEKWKGQIEKDLPRTFPGHPALDEDGRNALRRLLTAYARHNPSVGYCQAMNFFAGLLLLLMPEENAFWTLMGILDDYFDGYYSEEMMESQVDQLVFEELVRERFPKLVNHLDYLGVQVGWVTGPWFLSIFMNMLPWESVLRVWDVLLFEGNRVMLFRTALALMELYGTGYI